MSQSGQKTDKARTRGRASTGTPPTPAPPGSDPEPAEGGVTPAVPINKPEINLQPALDIEVTLSKILQRLDCLDGVREDLASIGKKVGDYDERHSKEIAQLTRMLEESNRIQQRERREHSIVKHELNIARENNRRMANQINELENKQKICNVRFDGIREDEREDLRKFVLETAKIMGLTNLNTHDVLSVYRIGKQQGAQTGQRKAHQKPRTVNVTFATEATRNKFYFARAKLHTFETYKGIYMNDDVSQTTRRLRDDFRSVAALARGEGAEVRVHSDGIVLDNHKYYLTEPQLLPSKFSLQAAKTREFGGEIYFATEHSFLSNFSHSPITENDVVFSTAEHLYQAQKCRKAGDLDKMRKVIDATTPLEAKRIADSVMETPEWRACRDEVMSRIINMKFDQNPSLAAKLSNTGNMVLNEATHNNHFGIGVPLHAKEIADKSYRGDNQLGRILMDKRADIKATTTNN